MGNITADSFVSDKARQAYFRRVAKAEDHGIDPEKFTENGYEGVDLPEAIRTIEKAHSIDDFVEISSAASVCANFLHNKALQQGLSQEQKRNLKKILTAYEQKVNDAISSNKHDFFDIMKSRAAVSSLDQVLAFESVAQGLFDTHVKLLGTYDQFCLTMYGVPADKSEGRLEMYHKFDASMQRLVKSLDKRIASYLHSSDSDAKALRKDMVYRVDNAVNAARRGISFPDLANSRLVTDHSGVRAVKEFKKQLKSLSRSKKRYLKLAKDMQRATRSCATVLDRLAGSPGDSYDALQVRALIKYSEADPNTYASLENVFYVREFARKYKGTAQKLKDTAIFRLESIKKDLDSEAANLTRVIRDSDSHVDYAENKIRIKNMQQIYSAFGESNPVLDELDARLDRIKEKRRCSADPAANNFRFAMRGLSDVFCVAYEK